MIKKILAASVLLFGLGINAASAQQVIDGPKQYEKIVIEHPIICSSAKDMKAYLDEYEYFMMFSGKNDMVSFNRSVTEKETPSWADVLYSPKMKSVITIAYDFDKNTACILTGIDSPNVGEHGINAALGIKN